MKLAIFGIVSTILYFIALGYFLIGYWGGFSELDPNEWGDFVAGSFGPLALFWLILGFFQQGRELKNSANALKLQAEELNHSVKEQAKLATAAAEQIAFERQKFQSLLEEKQTAEKGRFIVDGTSWYHNGEFIEHYIDVTNLGHAVAQFAFLPGHGVIGVNSEEYPDAEMEYPVWEQFCGRRYCYRLSPDYDGGDITFDLLYTNVDGEKVFTRYLMSPQNVADENFELRKSDYQP